MILTHSRLPVASNSLFLETPCRYSPRQYFGMDRPTTCQQFNCSLSFVKIAHTLCSFFFFSNRTIVTINIIAVIMLYYPSFPPVLQMAFTIPNIVLTNVMASRVFRNTMLFDDWSERERGISTIRFQDV